MRRALITPKLRLKVVNAVEMGRFIASDSIYLTTLPPITTYYIIQENSGYSNVVCHIFYIL